MVELRLERAPDQRRLYSVAGIGTLRFHGLMSGAAIAEAKDGRWRLGRHGVWRRRVEATDVDGTTIGAFEPRGMRCGGAVRWNGRELELRPSSAWRERYTLVDGDDELAVSDGKGWGTQTRHDRRRVSRKHSIPAWFSASGSRS